MLSSERYDALLQSYSAEELYRRRCGPKEMTCMVGEAGCCTEICGAS